MQRTLVGSLGVVGLWVGLTHAIIGGCPGGLVPLDPDGAPFTVSTCGQGDGIDLWNFPGNRLGQEVGYRVQMPAGPYTVTICPAVGVPSAVEVWDLENGGTCNGTVYGGKRVYGGRCGSAVYSGFEASRDLAILVETSPACGPVTITVTPSPGG